MSDTSPLFDFANQGTLTGVLDEAKNSLLKNLENCLPAKIVSYDRTTNRASVQIQIAMVTTSNTLVTRTSLASVPVWASGGGGFVISFPLISGSTGWIKACDRDISRFLKSMALAAPNTKIKHRFANGFFIPDVITGFVINAEDTANLVIQNMAGTVRIALWPNQVKITAPTIVLDGNVATTGTLTNNGVDVGSGHAHLYTPGSGSPTETGPPNE